MVRLVCWILLATACRGSSREHAVPSNTGSAATIASPRVALRVDDVALRTVDVDDAPLSLAALVPGAATWFGVIATASDGRYLEVDAPATTYPGGDIRISREMGRVTVAVYRAPVTGVSPEVAAIAAQPVNRLTGITQIDIYTRPPATTAERSIDIRVPGRPPRELADEDLARLVEVHDKHARGWKLSDVIASVAPQVSLGHIRVKGDSELDLSAEQLATAMILLKKNQRGEYVLQVYGSNTERAERQVRGVTEISVIP